MSATGQSVSYRLLSPHRQAADLEQEMLDRWAEEGLFERSLAAQAGQPEFVFYEGPPTANGRPGIHHVFSRTIKDLFCRYRAMRGYHVTRKAGWDTHGLPVEIEVEKQLGISGKQEIEAIGVARFNELCRESVWRYRADWERLSTRIGYWLDYTDPYITYSHEYVESVWWALRTLHDRQLLYRGHKILPYCARCGTALSSHEVAQGYEVVEDPSVIVALDLEDASDLRRRILVWTTTPWTLVSNVALAVHPDLEYLELRKKTGASWTVILAAARADAVLGEDHASRWDIVRRLRGTELAGLRYRRPLDWVSPGEGRHQEIVTESFVSAEDGTGVVHMAPAFGADDYQAAQRHGLAFMQPVDARGRFAEGLPLVGGRFVKDADPLIVEELRRRDVLWKAATLEHSYPHCWRCGTPLLYYARGSWFVRTTAVRDQMLSRNARVDWHPPEMGEKRFGEWLTNNIDWAISRDRYWGTPLPVWVCDADPEHVHVVGSYSELEGRTGAPLPEDFDPHKPHIDQYQWPCDGSGAGGEACRGTMRRVPEVIDTWFDSGSMPFAQWHFPFENREAFARHYPGDFIAEGVDQTRGWFYSLLAIATGLGDALPGNTVQGTQATAVEAAPYRSVVVNDLVLDPDGQKMSKSRGNVVDPWAVLERHGADAVRLFLVSSSQVWLPRRFDEALLRETSSFLQTLKNVYSGMFAQYASFGWSPSADDPPPAQRPPSDRWVLARLTTLELRVDELLASYDATLAAREVMRFVDEDVSKWYVRLNRHRFYDVDRPDNRAAFATLHEVLLVSCRLLAPFAPFVTDWIHRELTGESVHLAPFVRPVGASTDVSLESGMAAVRRLATLGRAAREEAGIRVRQPLSRMVCVVPDVPAPELDPLLPLLAAELNVKQVELASSAESIVRLEAKPNFRALGRRFGRQTPLAAQAIASLDESAIRAFDRGEPVAITVDGEERTLEQEDLTVVRRASGDLAVAEEDGYLAALDPAITPALRQEGLMRELIREVQRLRKESGLAVSDRISLAVWGNEEVEAAVREHRDRIAAEVLARTVLLGDGMGTHHAAQTVDLDGLAVHVAITRD